MVGDTEHRWWKIVWLGLVPVTIVALGTLGGQGCGQCDAFAECAAGQIEVESCPEGATCTETEVCGNSVLCMRDPACDPAPTCNDGDVEVDACPSDVTCYEVDSCGLHFVCAPGSGTGGGGQGGGAQGGGAQGGAGPGGGAQGGAGQGGAP